MVEFPNIFHTDKSALFCKFSECALTGQKVSNVKQHIATKRHKNAVDTMNKSKKFKQTLIAEQQPAQKINPFNMDICKTFLEANIPLKKISHPSVKNFVAKYPVKGFQVNRSV